MRNKSGLFYAWLLTLPLLGYTAVRNVSLILTTMREDALSTVSGLFALFALDLGVLLWVKMLDKADSDDQAGLATIMIVVDMAGVIVGSLADTLLVSAEAGVVATVQFVAIWVMGGVIGINFVAGIVYKLKDPSRAEDMEQRRIAREIQRERSLAALETQRAQADAEIALERARATQIRQSSALDMLNQVRNLMGDESDAVTPGARSSRNGHRPASAPMHNMAPPAAPVEENLTYSFMTRWARNDDEMDPEGMDPQALKELLSAFEYVKRKPANQRTEDDRTIMKWAGEVRSAQPKKAARRGRQ